MQGLWCTHSRNDAAARLVANPSPVNPPTRRRSPCVGQAATASIWPVNSSQRSSSVPSSSSIAFRRLPVCAISAGDRVVVSRLCKLSFSVPSDCIVASIFSTSFRKGLVASACCWRALASSLRCSAASLKTGLSVLSAFFKSKEAVAPVWWSFVAIKLIAN